MSVSGVGGIAGVDLSRLAQLYRQQVLSGGADATGATNGTGAAAATGSAGGVSGVGGVGATAATAGVQAVSATDPAAATRGVDFASAIGNGLASVENLDRTAAAKATQAATGDLNDVQDYVIAATQAQTATELTTTVRNKALDAFNEIMRMPL
jgi:flagellar hook-basal body complex protein FliE